MTAKVVSLADKRLEKQPHISGECRCISCQHIWVQVEPWYADGCTWIECPKCHRQTGRYFEAFAWRDKEYFVCMCGNDLFKVYADGAVMCPSCGSMRTLEQVSTGDV